MKPFLSNNGASINKTTLADNDKVMSDDRQLSKTFCNFFQEAVKNLDVK